MSGFRPEPFLDAADRRRVAILVIAAVLSGVAANVAGVIAQCLTPATILTAEMPRHD